MQKLVGRLSEIKVLKEALVSNEAEMIAVIGRRRVGKTFLIKKTYKDLIEFSITGIQNASKTRATKGILSHIYGKIAAASVFLAIF